MTVIIPSAPEMPLQLQPVRPLMRRDQLANYLRETWGITRTVASLAKLAVVGGGPPFHKDGRYPLYDPVLVDAWARQHLGAPRASTSDGRC